MNWSTLPSEFYIFTHYIVVNTNPSDIIARGYDDMV
jgi:hypothetical protein